MIVLLILVHFCCSFLCDRVLIFWFCDDIFIKWTYVCQRIVIFFEDVLNCERFLQFSSIVVRCFWQILIFLNFEFGFEMIYIWFFGFCIYWLFWWHVPQRRLSVENVSDFLFSSFILIFVLWTSRIHRSSKNDGNVCQEIFELWLCV